MRSRLPLPIANPATNSAFYGHPSDIREVVVRLQNSAELLRFDQYVVIICVPDPFIQFGRVICYSMGRIRRALYNSIIMDSGVYEDASYRSAFVKPVDTQGLCQVSTFTQCTISVGVTWTSMLQISILKCFAKIASSMAPPQASSV
jgi:hypothetical protein